MNFLVINLNLAKQRMAFQLNQLSLNFERLPAC